ncbi:MAG: DUF5677 domain-containing protein [Xanthobacteraceae bacterium]
MAALDPSEPLFAIAQKIMDAGVGIVAGAKVEIGSEWARNPKVIALALLSRTLANLKGGTALLRDGLVVEARTVTRCACENFICIGGLAAHGSKFVEDLVADEAVQRRRQGKFVLGRFDADVDDTGEKLRHYLDEMERKHPKARQLNLRHVADTSAVKDAYLQFMMLSSDSAHVSARSLNRHFAREHERDTIFLSLNVAPEPTQAELRQTLDWLCAMSLGVCVGANEVLGGTPVGTMLRSLSDEFQITTRARK